MGDGVRCAGRCETGKSTTVQVVEGPAVEEVDGLWSSEENEKVKYTL